MYEEVCTVFPVLSMHLRRFLTVCNKYLNTQHRIFVSFYTHHSLRYMHLFYQCNSASNLLNAKKDAYAPLRLSKKFISTKESYFPA